MTAKTHSRGTISTGILCLTMLLVVTSFANGNNEPNTPLPTRPGAGQFQYTGALCGHITDANTGQLVTDATVTNRNMFHAQTDANGFYIIENIPAGGDFRIAVDSNEYIGITDYRSMSSVRIQRGAQTVKDFKLDKACMIEVRVVDEANQPIEGAEVSVVPSDNETQRRLWFRSRRTIQTSKDGIATLGGLIPDKTGYMIIARQSDYAPGRLVVMLNSTEYLESGQIILRKGEDVKGQAFYEDGAPATDLTINVYCSNSSRSYNYGSSPVDTNGNFTLSHIIPDFYRISADKPAGKEGPVSIADLSTELPLPNKEALIINVPMKSTQPLVSISGKLIFTNNNIPGSVYIYASSADDRHYSSTEWRKTGKDACDTTFVIDRLVPGKYKITFSSFIKLKTVENIEAPTDGLEVELETSETFVLTGTVVNSQTGTPIQSFKARIKQLQSFSGTQNYQSVSQWQDINSMEGKFNMEIQEPGIYQVQIAAEGFAWTNSEAIDTGRNAPVVIKLSLGGTIKGMVVNDSGQPINNAKVTPLSKAVETTSYIKDVLISDSDTVITVNGSFELNNLASGMESIKVVHPDYAPSIIDNIEVKDGKTTKDIKVVLHKGGTVEGYVYDPAGRPQADITLIFQNTPGYNLAGEKTEQLATVTTDASGYYRADNLPEEICYVRKQQSEGNAQGVVRRAFVPAGGKVSRYDFGGQPVVKGTAVWDGKPLADCSLFLMKPEAPYSPVFQCNIKTGPNGEFTFGGIPKGKWSISRLDVENNNNPLRMAVIDATGQDMDIGVIPNNLLTLSVSIKYEQNTANWDVTDVYMQYENIFWGTPVAMFKRPASNNEPYIARNILPGRYHLVVNRGCVTQQSTIDVTEDNTNITVRIPKSTASIRGHLVSNYNDWQVLWRDGKEVVCYMKPDANGNYEFNNLQAGKYHLSADSSTNSGILLEFELAEGEQKVLDIDTTNMQKNRQGILLAIVLDEYGIPTIEADVQLEGNDNIDPIIASVPGFYFAAEPGTYTLHTKLGGYKEVSQSVTAKKWDLQTMKRPPDPVFVRLEK